MIPFTKPGRSEDWDVMAEKAIRLALKDTEVGYEQVQQAYVGYIYAGFDGWPVGALSCRTGASAQSGFGRRVRRHSLRKGVDIALDLSRIGVVGNEAEPPFDDGDDRLFRQLGYRHEGSCH